MERDDEVGGGGESEAGCAGDAAEAWRLSALRRYSAGEISAREMGPRASENDVLAGVLAAGLGLPVPDAGDVAREVEGLRGLYGQRQLA